MTKEEMKVGEVSVITEYLATCPYCGDSDIEVRYYKQGDVVECDSCNKEFILGDFE